MGRRLRLMRPAYTRSPAAALPGDPCGCPECTGAIGVYTTRRSEDSVTRYLECRACKWKPPNNKLIERPFPPSSADQSGDFFSDLCTTW